MHLFFRVNKTNAWIHPAVSERGTNMYLARASVFYHTAVQAWICWGEFNPSTTALVSVFLLRTDNIVFYKLNKPSLSNTPPPPSLLAPLPPQVGLKKRAPQWATLPTKLEPQTSRSGVRSVNHFPQIYCLLIPYRMKTTKAVVEGLNSPQHIQA